jgi:AraC family transcriptional regulator
VQINLQYKTLDHETRVRYEKDDFQAFLVTKGVIETSLPTDPHLSNEKLCAGAILFVPPSRNAQIEFNGACVSRKFAIPRAFIQDLFDADHFAAIATHLETPAVIRDPFAYALLRLIAASLQENSEFASPIARSATKTFLLRVAAKLSTGTSLDAQVDQDALSEILSYIDDNIASSLSITKLATLTKLTKAQITRGIKIQFDTSPGKYIANRRVQIAKKMLLGTDLSIAEVALACGFCSQSHMTESFTRIEGQSPGRIRNNRKGKKRK